MVSQKYPTRFLIFSSALLIQSLAGTAYAFSLMSDAIKSRLGLSQTQLDSVASFGNVGLYLSIVCGLFINRYGTSMSIWIGTALSSLSFLLITLITLGQFGHSPSPGEWTALLCFLNALYHHGNAWLTTSAMVTVARSFPKSDQAVVLGMGKAFFGLSSALVSEWKVGLARNNVSLFMAMISVLIPTGLFIVGWNIVALPKDIALHYDVKTNELGYDLSSLDCGMGEMKSPQKKSDQRGARVPDAEEEAEEEERDESLPSSNEIHAFLTPWYCITVCFAVYLVSISLLQKETNINNDGIAYTLFFVTIALWLSPFALSYFAHGGWYIRVGDKHERVMDNVTIGMGGASSMDADGGNLVSSSIGSVELGAGDTLAPPALGNSTVRSTKSASRSLSSLSNEMDDTMIDGSALNQKQPKSIEQLTSLDLDDEIGSLDRIQPEKQANVVVPSMSEEVRTFDLPYRTDFWLMWLVFCLMAGSGLSLINNLAQIVDSLNSNADDERVEDDGLTDFLVSLVSFCNFSGRLCSGALLAFVMRKVNEYSMNQMSNNNNNNNEEEVQIHHRFIALGIIASGMGTGFGMMVFFKHATILLFIPTMFVSFSFGWLFGSMIILANHMWGQMNLAGNYAILDSAAMIGSLVFATGVSGAMYDSEGRKEHSDNHECYGQRCYEWTFVICSVNCFVSSMLCGLLYIRQKALLEGRPVTPLSEEILHPIRYIISECRSCKLFGNSREWDH